MTCGYISGKDTFMIAGLTYYQALQYFVIYSILGWCVEVIYQAAAKGIVVNRGFLNGPVCPIYGFGVISVFALLGAFSPESMYGASGLLVFAEGIVLATAIELFGGWALDKIFHARWWDYSSKPLNFHGYICLEFSLIWGLGIVFVVKILQPTIESLSAAILPESRIGWILLAVVYTGYAADVVVSAMIMAGLNRRMAELDEMRRRMRVVSDGLSKTLGEGALETAQKVESAEVQMALAKAEFKDNIEKTGKEISDDINAKKQENMLRHEEMKAEYDRKAEELMHKIRGSQFLGTGRVLRAFPQMEHREYDEILKRIRKRMEERRQ